MAATVTLVYVCAFVWKTGFDDQSVIKFYSYNITANIGMKILPLQRTYSFLHLVAIFY